MSACAACAAGFRYTGGMLHDWSCGNAELYRLPRHPDPALYPKRRPLKCDCGSSYPPLKGAGHSHWCDVEVRG